MVLSVDRYIAIRHPTTFRAFSDSKHAWRVVVAIWVISLIIMIPLILVRRVDVIHLLPADAMHFCSEIWATSQKRKLYDAFLFVFMFIMPGCFLSVSYSRIGCQLWIETRGMYQDELTMGHKQADKLMCSRRKMARMLVILAIIFALCWMPVHILNLYLDFVVDPGNSKVLEALPFTLWLGHANSAANPILYCFMSKSFRRCVAKLLRCRRRKCRRKLPDSPVCVFNYIIRIIQ